MDLSQAVAVITGAGSGIGKQLAMQLSRGGARVAINDCDPETLAQTVREITELGGTAWGQAFDVGSREAMQAFADGVRERYGQADIMINNAGVALGMMNLEEVRYDDLRWIIDVNLWGVIHGTMVFLPMLRERPEAHLVNVSSTFGLLAVPGQAPYCATKFAVRGFTDSIRLELMGTKVCVTLVCPSKVRTNIVRNGRHKDEQAKSDLIKKFDERMTKFTPDQMATAIIDGMLKKREQILFGRNAHIVSLASRILPRSVIKAVARKALESMERNGAGQ
jgi:NADP-dependent 3-hydroxy acid dehydrogenase YdfG